MAGQKMSLEEATSARLPFDVAEYVDIEAEKETRRKAEERKQARAEHLKTVGKMAFTQQCIDDKIMPLKKQKRIIGKYTYGLKGTLFANIKDVPNILYATSLLLFLALVFSTIVTIGCATAINESALLEWVGTTTEEFKATFFHFILPIPFVSLGLFWLNGFFIISITGEKGFSNDAKEKIFEEFTKKTGIKVEFLDISSGEVLSKLNAQNGKIGADVWFGGGADSFIVAGGKGYLENYVSPEEKEMDQRFIGNDYWTGVSIVTAGFLVNTDVLAKNNIPEPASWEDLKNPKYKDELTEKILAIGRELDGLNSRMMNPNYVERAPAELVRETRNLIAEKEKLIEEMKMQLNVI